MSDNVLRQLGQIEPATSWEMIGPVLKSRECDLYRAESPETGRSIAIKIYHANVNPAAPQQQFEALSLKQHPMAAPTAIYRVPRAYSFDSKTKTLLMDWAEGDNLFHRLWRGLRTKSINQDIFLAGAWLRTFHQASPLKVQKTDYSYYQKADEKRTDHYDDTSALLGDSHSLFDESMAVLKKWVQEQPENFATHAILHGDFTPYNLLIDGKTVTGIDMWGATYQLIYVDLARMTVYLTIAYPLFFCGTLFNRQGQMHPQISTLFNGYGTDLADPASNHLRIAILSEYLRRWLVIENRKSRGPRRLTDRFQILRIQNQIKSILPTMPTCMARK